MQNQRRDYTGLRVTFVVLCIRGLLEMLVGLELAGMDDVRIVMHLTCTANQVTLAVSAHGRASALQVPLL